MTFRPERKATWDAKSEDGKDWDENELRSRQGRGRDEKKIPKIFKNRKFSPSTPLTLPLLADESLKEKRKKIVLATCFEALFLRHINCKSLSALYLHEEMR
jgi:hypothetical protein